MKSIKSSYLGWKTGSLALALAFLSVSTTVRANVYATDIQISSTLTGSYSDPVGTPVNITYHLNDNATAGVTIKILKGTTVVSTISIASPNAGTLMGLNTVAYTPTSAGTYSVSITAAATGYSTWQQYSPIDANHAALYPHGGLDVDKNPSSPYYGRIIVVCATSGTIATTGPANGVVQQDGFYKYNSDGTPADEGGYGYAQYTTDDGGNISANNSVLINGNTNIMANGRAISGGANTLGNPVDVQIGEDDRIYWIDDSASGSVQACDMQAIGPAQTIITESGYAGCPDDSLLNQGGDGWRRLMVINTATTSTSTGVAALFIDDYGDFPNAGPWMWHLVGSPGSMVADPTDTVGSQVVFPGTGSAISLRGDGIAVDYNLDLFVGEDRSSGTDPANRTVCYTNWNGGVLPAGGSGFGVSPEAAETVPAYWVEGSLSATEIDVWDVVIDSRSNPTLVAVDHFSGAAPAGGITLLNAFNAVYNLTSVVNNGNGTLTINCAVTSPYQPAITASSLTVVSSPTITGPFSTSVPISSVSGNNSGFQLTIAAPSATTFYEVGGPVTGGGTVVAGSAVTLTAAGTPVTSTLANIDAGHIYYAPAFDAVGNLYGATTSDNYLRVWSPPGANTNTTLAVATLTAH